MRLTLTFAALLAAASCAPKRQPAPDPAPACCTATIRVTVPEGTGTVYLSLRSTRRNAVVSEILPFLTVPHVPE
jgi:hypothetical protein